MFGLKTLQSQILTIFIAVIIISAYNLHTADIAIQYRLPPVIVDAGTKTEGFPNNISNKERWR